MLERSRQLIEQLNGEVALLEERARQAEVAAASHCQKLGLPAPVYVVAEEGDMADLMRVLPEILARGALGRDGERRRGDEPSSRGAGGAPPAAAAKGGPAREAGRPGGLGPAGFATVVCVMALLGAVAWRMRERGWVDARRVWLWWRGQPAVVALAAALPKTDFGRFWPPTRKRKKNVKQ